MTHSDAIGLASDDAGSHGSPLPIVGVSMPRSGHHFLQTLMASAFGADLGYCSEFAHGRCCATLPCSRPQGRYFLTKSHDYQLRLSPELPSALYLIQDREPQGRLLSAVELITKNRDRDHTRVPNWPIEHREFAAWWLANEALYTVGFRRKWVGMPPKNSLIIEYDELVSEPAAWIERIAAMLGRNITKTTIESLRKVSPIVAGRTRQFRKRDVGESNILPADLVAEYNAVVCRRVPPFRISLNSVTGRSNEIEPLYRKAATIKALDRSEAINQARQEAEVGNRYFLLALAKRLERLNEFEAAYDLLNTIVSRSDQTEELRAIKSQVADRRIGLGVAIDVIGVAVAASAQPTAYILARLQTLTKIVYEIERRNS